MLFEAAIAAQNTTANDEDVCAEEGKRGELNNDSRSLGHPERSEGSPSPPHSHGSV